jgi:hypothetical protein
MATSGSFNTSSVGNFYFTFAWSKKGHSSEKNEHYIYYEVIAHNTAGNYRTVYLKNLWINGEQKFYESGSQSNGKSYYDGNVVTSGNITIPGSNSAGDGYIVASFEAGVGVLPGVNCSGPVNPEEGSWDLDRIPRHANFTEHYISSTGLNSITVRWNTDAYVDWVQYSLNDGSWQDTAGLDYTISGLNPNTWYNIRTRIRRTDSGLWTETGYIGGTTKDIAKITSAYDFNLGDNAKITIYNPSGEHIHYFVETLNPTKTIIERTAVSGENTITFSQDELDHIYKKMGTSNSTAIRLGVATKNSYWDWQDKTCTLTGNQKTGHVNVNGSWKRTKKYVNVNGTWKRCVRWVNVDGNWRRCI